MSNENEPKAFIDFQRGPMDGLEMRWPSSGNDFPAIIAFGEYVWPEGVSTNDILRRPSKIRIHEYHAYHCWAEGEVLEDGLPQSEFQSYTFAKTIERDAKSISELWDES